MLSLSDSQLAARDTTIPGLRLLLDEQALMHVINTRLPGAGVRRVEKKYIRYKPGTNCLVRYELETDSGDINIYAKAHGPCADVKLKKALKRQAAASWSGIGRLTIAEHNIVICAFPNDDKLKVLHRLGNHTQREKLFRSIFPDQPAFHRAVIETLQYRPERRYVACLRSPCGEQAAIKFYTRKGFSAAQQVYNRLKEADDSSYPSVIGLSRRHRGIASRWITGDRLSDIYSEPDFDLEWLHELGSHLAEFHNQPDVARLMHQSSEYEAARLNAVAEKIPSIAPEHAKQTYALAQQIGNLLQPISHGMMRVHGDFNAKQVLCTGSGIQLVDCDDMGCGNPATDLGLFIANLERDVLRGRLSRERSDRLEETFLQGYSDAMNSELFGQIQLYTAAGLLRALHHPFRNCEPEYIERMALILAACEARLADFKHSSGTRSKAIDSRSRQTIKVLDPYSVTHDPAMPYLEQALDPDSVARALDQNLNDWNQQSPHTNVHAIQVQRYRPGRRCLIEYLVSRGREPGTAGRLSLLGKSRARGLDIHTWRLNRSLYEKGFTKYSVDGIAVPEPVGCIPPFNMWLQKKVTGIPGWVALSGSNGLQTGHRIADAIYKLHTENIPAKRSHTANDELRILENRLTTVMELRPQWSVRLEKILEACYRLVTDMNNHRVTGIHRDFYHDQVIVDENCLYLLDLDLFCAGDPALDIGNFVAHIQEQCLREKNDIDAMHEITRTIIERYQQRSGLNMAAMIDSYRKLTLVRHISISQRLTERHAHTEQLIRHCEVQLHIPQSIQEKKLFNK